MTLQSVICRTLLALAVIVCATERPAQAEDREVHFCFNDWPPYAQLQDGKPAGISVEILREASRRAHLYATFRELPWKRCLEMVRGGEIDAVMDAMHRPDFLQGPTSFSVYTNTVWVDTDDALLSLDFKALRGRRLGLVDGYDYPESLWADIKSNGVAIEYSVDDGTNIRKLAFGRIDAIVGDFASTMLFVRDNGLRLRALEPTHSADRLYASFNVGRGEVQKAIDGALREMMEDGFIDGVYRRHLGTRYSDMKLPAASEKE